MLCGTPHCHTIDLQHGRPPLVVLMYDAAAKSSSLVFGGTGHIDIVVADRIVAVGASASSRQRRKQVLAPVLQQQQPEQGTAAWSEPGQGAEMWRRRCMRTHDCPSLRGDAAASSAYCACRQRQLSWKESWQSCAPLSCSCQGCHPSPAGKVESIRRSSNRMQEAVISHFWVSPINLRNWWSRDGVGSQVGPDERRSTPQSAGRLRHDIAGTHR